jgi:hypothetical protein
MKSKIVFIAGSVLALAITVTEPVHAKGCECTGPELSADKSVPLPPRKDKSVPLPPQNSGAYSPSKPNPSGERVALGRR